MKLVLVSAAMALTAIPAAPALAHCRTVHHQVHPLRHVAVAQVRVRHHPVRYASACGCATRVAYRPAVYRAAYPRPRIVEVTYERPRPFYRPYRLGYAVPLYRPRPVFYHARFERPFHRRWEDRGFHRRWADGRDYGRHERWGGWR
jgi:hypothetical protein